MSHEDDRIEELEDALDTARAERDRLRAELRQVRAACEYGLGVIARSDLKGTEPRTAIALMTTALSTPSPATPEREAALIAALTLLRSRLPQPCLDDYCDWQRGVIDGVLGSGSGAGGEGGEA